LSESVGSGSAFVSTISVTTNTPGIGSSTTSTIVVSVCGVSHWVGGLRRLEAGFFVPDRPDLALVFCRFALVLSGRFAACLVGGFAFLAAFLNAFLDAFAFRAFVRLVRLAIILSL
jgi:hypothetical protein